jgi:hypothetical protein
LDDVSTRVKKEALEYASQKVEELKETKNKVLESKKKNLIKVSVESPIVELPFANSPQQLESKESWSIKIGDFNLDNDFEGSDTASQKQLRVTLSSGHLKHVTPNSEASLIENFTVNLTLTQSTLACAEEPATQVHA